MTLPRSVFGVVAVFLVGGCFDFDGGEGCNFANTNGLADNATFTYECRSEADPACDNLEADVTPTLPTAIALGARFGLRVGSLPVTPVSPKAVQTTGGSVFAYVALRPGGVGFVFRQDGEAVDAVRFDIVEPTGIAIARARSRTDRSPGFVTSASIPRLDLMIDGQAAVRAVALRSSTQNLAGTLDVSWAVDDADVVSADRAPDGTCLLTAVRAGTATLTATSGTLSASVVVRVDAPFAEDDAGIVDGGNFDAGDLDGSDASEGDAS